MITYQVETWSEFLKDALPLFQIHWEELDKGYHPELDMNWDTYVALEAAKIILVVTVRLDSKLIGYSVNLVSPALHFKTVKHSFADFFFILQEYRKGFVGFKLFKEVEKELKTLGVERIHMGSRSNKSLNSLFKKLGYTPYEEVYFKDIK
jgi:GNAT superfamily N-acetyltransferase